MREVPHASYKVYLYIIRRRRGGRLLSVPVVISGMIRVVRKISAFCYVLNVKNVRM